MLRMRRAAPPRGPIASTGDRDPRRSAGRFRPLAVIGMLVAALLGSIALAVTLGPADLRVTQVVASVLARMGGPDPGLTPIEDGIIWSLRLPRIVGAAVVGAGLALCGAVMQATTRNPLADPYLLGLSSGASVGAVIALVLGLQALLPVAAFLGAMVALVGALGLAHLAGGLTPARTILAGVAVSSLGGALTSLLIFWHAQGDSYRDILSWIMGSLSGVEWSATALAAGALLVVGLPIMAAARLLDAFAFGDSAAAALGVRVGAVRWSMLAATAVLTGVLVSMSGAIGFIGLVVPHAARLFVGPGYRTLLPVSALVGAILLVWADTAARTAFDPRELPVGIVTAIIGAPLFALLLARRKGDS
ncbi:ABC transporter (iron.B12.siderophore.hemin), permease component [Brevibacterium yomogidense]|uniref:ABC transporter (Iron.B12.siderophore.hemin), permease component n=2 Tax=Brevibacterium yomogidense TaxID=946573 RepID=A0A1X6WY70_9MICO|nr:ABC transporter (iron.B12.siderophore.hemin), permease component [Brevibacterium yomogidense]